MFIALIHGSYISSLPCQDDAAAARMLLVEMMADLDEEVAELFLMEEEVLLSSREMIFSHCWLIHR